MTKSKSKQVIEVADPNGVSAYFNRTLGSFVVITNENDIRWVGRCRVEFEWDLKKNGFFNRIGFIRPGLDIELMEDFWNQIFKQLGKASKLRVSKFPIHKSNMSNLCIIDVPKFWNDTDTGRSLFSLLLRASVCHHEKGNSYLKTLQSYPLANKVIPAIEWFLKGNTIQTYEAFSKLDAEGYVGFVAEFEDLSKEEIKSKLVSKIRSV